MRVISDEFQISATYNEVADILEGLKLLYEKKMKNLSERNNGIPEEMHLMQNNLMDLAVILGKKEEMLKYMHDFDVQWRNGK